MYVWYLSYGSNINTQRFHTYITGGQYNDSVHEQGARNKALPLEEKNIIIHHQLYFAGSYKKWSGQGVAFIRQTKDPQAKTYAKMYLIEISQFEDVVKQENGLDVNQTLQIDYKQIEALGYTDLDHQPYGRLLQLGSQDGYPIYSFTAPEERKDLNPPSPEYLSTILKGISKSHGIDDPRVKSYIKSLNDTILNPPNKEVA